MLKTLEGLVYQGIRFGGPEGSIGDPCSPGRIPCGNCSFVLSYDPIFLIHILFKKGQKMDSPTKLRLAIS